MKKTLILILIAGVLGCYTDPQQYGSSVSQKAKKPELIEQEILSGMVRRAYLGISYDITSNNQIEVMDVTPGYSAEEAGLQRGDHILSLDSLKIESNQDLGRLLYEKMPGDVVLAAIERNGETTQKRIKLSGIEDAIHFVYIDRRLLENKPVRLAIVVREIVSALPDPEGLYDSWVKGTKQRLSAETEGFLLRRFGHSDEFSVVDRDQINSILREMELGESGLIEKNVEIGRMTGANYILTIDFARSRGYPSGFDDLVTDRLIEIETGTVVATFVRRLSYR